MMAKQWTVVAQYRDNDQVVVAHVAAIDGKHAIAAAERWARAANGWDFNDYGPTERCLTVYAVLPGHLISEADDFDDEGTGIVHQPINLAQAVQS